MIAGLLGRNLNSEATTGVSDAGMRSTSHFVLNKNKEATNMNFINIDAVIRAETSQGARCEEMAFAIGKSALGTILVARSAEGVCAIFIGSEPAELESDLAAQFTESKLVRDDRKLGDDLRKILRFIETPAEGLDLALDIRGTSLQQRVWEALLKIPTVTYGALAAGSANPTLFGPLQTPVSVQGHSRRVDGVRDKVRSTSARIAAPRRSAESCQEQSLDLLRGRTFVDAGA